MKILFLTSLPLEYNASSTLRNLALIKGLISLGHEVDTLTAAPSRDFVTYDETMINKLNATRYYIPKGKIYTAFTSKKNDINKARLVGLLKRFARNIYFRYSIFDPLKSLASNVHKVELPEDAYDLLVSSSDPISSHVIAEVLIKHSQGKFRRWAQYWGDPVLINIDRKSKLPRFMVKRVESQLLSKADTVVYVSPFTAEAQKSIYPQITSKINFIPIAYIERDVHHNTKREEPTYLRVGYFGDYFSENRDIMPICKVAEEGNIQLIIAGNSDIDISNKKGITVSGRLSYKKIKELESSCDVLVCICNRKGTQIPGKVYHYAATNKPILIITDGDSKPLKDYLKSFDRYILCDNNPVSIKEAIGEIALGHISVSCEPSTHLESANIAKRFLNSIEY